MRFVLSVLAVILLACFASAPSNDFVAACVNLSLIKPLRELCELPGRSYRRKRQQQQQRRVRGV